MRSEDNRRAARAGREERPRKGGGRGGHWGWAVWLGAWAWAASSAGSHGQEALRMSLASEEAARARREANTALGYYNLKLGPTAWRFRSGLGMEWNDNIRLTGVDPKSDFIFRPEVDAQMLWPVTEKNALNFRVGAGYSAYVQNPGYSRFFVRPGSEVSFDIYAGDFTINLHDRLSILEDAYLDPTVVGNGGYSRLENAVGTTVLWDLNQALVRWGYDHVNYASLNGNSTAPDGTGEMFYGSAGWRVGQLGMAGMELGGGLIDYETAGHPDAAQWNAGVFGESQFSEYISLRAAGGYMAYTPENGGGSDDFTGVYAQVSARHTVNERVRYELAGGRRFDFAFYGGSAESWYVRWTADWRVLWKTRLGTSVEYQSGEELDYGREEFRWVGGGLSLGRQLTRKLSATGGYGIHVRHSNLPSRDYVVNTVSVRLNYAF